MPGHPPHARLTTSYTSINSVGDTVFLRWTSAEPSITDTVMNFYVEFDIKIPDALFDVKKPMPVEDLFDKSP